MLVLADFFKPFISRCDVTTPVTLGGVNVFVPLVLVAARRLEVRCHHSPNEIKTRKKIATAIASLVVIWFFIVVSLIFES
jgi:hypothetical protein